MPAERFLTIGGETKRLFEWAREAGISPACLHRRLKHGIPPETAVEPGDLRSREDVRRKLAEARQGDLNPRWAGGRSKEELAAYMRGWRKKNEIRIREREYQKRFGITLAEYEAMLAAQGGVCAICDEPCPRGRLSVDHCHRTGRVRGLLCRRCNIAIGVFEDNSERFKRAGAYLAGKVTSPA